jgi:hypothetical protein
MVSYVFEDLRKRKAPNKYTLDPLKKAKNGQMQAYGDTNDSQ